MKRNIGLLMAALLIFAAIELRQKVEAASPKIDRSVAEFREPVKLLGVVLQGRYLFLHHEGMMSRGRPCTYVYSLDQDREGVLILSFHCTPIARDRARQFRVVTRNPAGQPPEIIELQFAGTSEGHQVPTLELAHY
jgi:hypothetical protein